MFVKDEFVNPIFEIILILSKLFSFIAGFRNLYLDSKKRVWSLIHYAGCILESGNLSLSEILVSTRVSSSRNDNDAISHNVAPKKVWLKGESKG